MQPLAELQELAELAASYSAAYERARAAASRPQTPPHSGTGPAAHTTRNADAARGTPADRAE